jgi:hypothetical protein
MPPRTPLGPRSANACIKRKSKTSRVELSPHKHSVIEGLHKGGCSVKDIMEIEEIPHSTVCDTFKLFTTRPKGQSLPHSGCPLALTKVQKQSIIYFIYENPKATYIKVKQQLLLYYSLRTICHIIQKYGIKK